MRGARPRVRSRRAAGRCRHRGRAPRCRGRALRPGPQSGRAPPAAPSGRSPHRFAGASRRSLVLLAVGRKRLVGGLSGLVDLCLRRLALLDLGDRLELLDLLGRRSLLSRFGRYLLVLLAGELLVRGNAAVAGARDGRVGAALAVREDRGAAAGVVAGLAVALARAGERRLGLGLGELLVGLDVHLPAGQAGGETGVQTLLADRERKLVVRDDDGSL